MKPWSVSLFCGTLAILSTLPLAAQEAQREQNCCSLLYGAGRWLGWSASYLDYTQARETPLPEDAVVLDGLQRAGESVAAANAACPRDLPAWEDFEQKQLWLTSQVEELQRPSDPAKSHAQRRQEIARGIAMTWDSWGWELSRQRFDSSLLRRTTCETYYFQLGFDLAYATQSYRQADAAWKVGDSQAALQQLNQTRMRLASAAEVLDGYVAVARCADIDFGALSRTVDMLTSSPPLLETYAEEMQMVTEAANRISEMLMANCVVRRPEQQAARAAPRDPGELSGEWSLHLLGWRTRTGAEWERRWLPRAREQQKTMLVVRFEKRGENDYVGKIVRAPSAEAGVPPPLDPWSHGRSQLFKPGMELLWLKKSSANRYDGQNLRLGLPGSVGYTASTCTIHVFGDVGRIQSPATARTPEQDGFELPAGWLMLRVGMD